MAWPTKPQQGTKHKDSCNRAFANLSPLGACPRCDELRAGSKPRAGWNDATMAQDAAQRRAIGAHFAPGGKHEQIVKNGGVDTAFDY